MEKYVERITQNNPCLIIILIDQSCSMDDFYGNTNKQKKELIALNANKVIYEILEASSNGEYIKNIFFISAISYGNTFGVDLILGDFINNIDEKILRIEKIKRKLPDGIGGLIEIDEDFPIWIEPKAECSSSMDIAFKRAYELCEKWVKYNKDSFPPLIINIVGGMPSHIENTKLEAKKLMKLSNNDGNVLLLNLYIVDGLTNSIIFPHNNNMLPNNTSKFLYTISSILPDTLINEANRSGLSTNNKAKGFIYDGNAEMFIRLLSFGSSVAR